MSNAIPNSVVERLDDWGRYSERHSISQARRQRLAFLAAIVLVFIASLLAYQWLTISQLPDCDSLNFQAGRGLCLMGGV